MNAFVKGDKWKMGRFLGRLDGLIGRMKIYKGKILTSYKSDKEFL